MANIYSASQIPGDIVGDILTQGYVNALTIKDWIIPQSEIGVIGDAFINNELSEMIYDDNYNDMILKELTSHSDIELNTLLEKDEENLENGGIQIESTESVSLSVEENTLIPVMDEIDIEINTLEPNTLLWKLYQIIDIINQGISWIEFYRKLDTLSSKELAKHFVARFLLFVSYDPSISYGHICRLLPI